MDGFKQRIIGALVLISLAVIFVPMLLDEPHEERTVRTIEIPAEPEFPEVRIEEAQPPEIDAPIPPVPEPENPPMATSSPASGETLEPMTGDAPVASPATPAGNTEAPAQASHTAPVITETADTTDTGTSASQPEPEVPTQPDPAPVTVDEPAQTGGYLVQLGSFGSASNARGLKEQVADTGFSARTTTVESGGKTFTRVFAGPFPDKAAADAAKQKLDREFGLNTLVVVND